jgi:hypothetical protein
MGDYEIIDLLCSVTTALSDIVRKQAEVIAQCEIANELAAELKEMRDSTDRQLDVIEYRLRRR